MFHADFAGFLTGSRFGQLLMKQSSVAREGAACRREREKFAAK
jgi:hypothetical protein